MKSNRTAVAAPPGAGPLVRPDVEISDPLPPRRRRRSFMVIGGVMVLAGAIGVAGLLNAAGNRSDVLVLAHDVPVGQKIGTGDLRVVALPHEPGLATTPAAQRSAVVGRRAAVALNEGSLLTKRQLAGDSTLRSGEELVAVEVKRGMAPVDALHPGDGIRLVTTPRDGEAVPDKGAGPREVSGRVVTVGRPSTSGDVVVQVAVAQADSSGVAADAGRIAIVLKAKS
ncbi:SAF domain-containing protein [Streptomyces sp. NBC_01500]|uniref:SAF domain-containing protein n=1 Tax=Streptomyces sp. NBC_01500 TaxID=2903886 RepID=UPI002251DCE8|nr:SAF domain-containing protein [Streptomyces sp. NBC_01500]MCX4554233.1 SAF domain-containing protein [Streptomyces sp. NBC_01500]